MISIRNDSAVAVSLHEAPLCTLQLLLCDGGLSTAWTCQDF